MNTPEIIEVILTYKIDKDDPDFSTEKVSAKKIENYYEVISVPAFANNLAYGDIIEVEFDDGAFHFSRLIKESGHSVLHIVLFNTNTNIISELKQLGCGVNYVASNYLVVDVP